MADISKIKLPDGTTYNIKDETARGYVTGVKGNSESSYRTGNVNLTPANIGAVSTSGNETVAGNKTFSGTTTLSPSSTYPTQQGTVVVAAPTTLIQSPIPKFLWHDIFAFCRDVTPKYYTSTNGTTWTETTLDKRLFSQQEAWGSIVVLSSTIKGSRWEWLNGGYYDSMASWLVLGITYTSPVNHFDLLFETSSDSGATWTTLCSSNNLNYSQTPIWVKLSGTCQDSVRLTITNNSESESNASLRLCSIKLLTHRWGNQGKGSEFEHPYKWNATPDIFPIANNVSSLGTSSYKWANIYSTNFTGNLTGNVTGNATNVTGTVAVANGGTGKTTTQAAANNLLGGLDNSAAQSTAPTDDTSFITTSTTGATGTYYHRKASLLWTYIKNKISSILGLTATNYGGTSAKATADASGNTITSYYAPKSTAVTNVALATNKITKTINGSTTDVVTAATTSAYGITKLNSATNSTSTTEAATPSAVKTAYDLANTANGTANTALSGVNGTLIYDHTYSISNGVATFTPHVYQKGAEVTSNYSASCFTWKYRLIDGSEVTLSTDSTTRGCSVTISNMGYGGHVIGTFTPA